MSLLTDLNFNSKRELPFKSRKPLLAIKTDIQVPPNVKFPHIAMLRMITLACLQG